MAAVSVKRFIAFKQRQTVALLHSNQGGAQTWEIRSVEQYEYKTDFNLNERKRFTNGTKQVLVQNKSWLQVQKHKGANATVCLDKFARFMLASHADVRHAFLPHEPWRKL